MRHPIVCGIDGSNESRLAARVAAELARALGRGLVLAHVTDDPPTFPYGDPGEALKSLCRDSDAALLVLGSTGRSGLAAAVHGSLPARLAGTAECPIVAVTPDAAERFLRASARNVDGESTRALQLANAA